MPDLLDKRLVIVTGKGGVGKSTVALAMGLAAAAEGRRTIVCEVSSQEHTSQVFNRAEVGFHEVEMAENLWAISIDPDEAMREYLLLQLRVRAMRDLLYRSRIFGYLAAATPGLRELVTIGKIWEVALPDRKVRKGREYDHVIVDAPATGHGVAFLQTPRTFANVARVGPIKAQAEALETFLVNHRKTGVAIVALPEEMPVNETASLERTLIEDVGVAVDRVYMNALYPERFSEERERGPRVSVRERQWRAPRRVPRRDQRAPARGGAARAARSPHRARERVGEDASVHVRAGARRRGDPGARWSARLMASVAELLDGKRVCICAGSGGVGKTTSSAAIAAGMAARGKRVAVLTIDPAKRLADSLGLPELGNEERQVDPRLFAEAGVETGGGELWAMMLDAKATFDDLVRRHAPDAETRDRILSNRIYQQLSNALAGSQEYMAMEKLFELYAEDRYDLLVLDTPPSRNALDFLEAPRRLMQFIEGRALQVFMKPTGLGMKVFGRGTSMMFSVLRRLTGVEVLEDLSEFFQAFSGMVGGFRERAKRVNELLANPESCFLVVCAPQGEPITEAVYFHRKLVEAGLPFGGVIVNKVHYETELPAYDESLERELTDALGDEDLARRVIENFDDYRALAARDQRNIKRLTAEMRARLVIQVPHLDEDVHDLAGLMRINDYLFASGARERSVIAAEA